MLAIEVERRIQMKREQTHNENHGSASNLAVSDIDDAVVKGTAECSSINNDTSAAVESLLDDNSSTMKDDANDEIDQIFARMEKSDQIIETAKPNKINTVQLSLTIDSNFNAYNMDDLSPSFSLHSSPSLGALDDSRNQSLYFTPMSVRDSLTSTPSHTGQFSNARLVRSNSYTLDKPSPMLLKHMANGVCLGPSNSPLRSPMALNEFRKNKINTPSGIPRKPPVKAVEGPTAQIKHNKPTISVTKAGTSSTRKLMSPIDSANSTLMTSSKSLNSTTKPIKQNASNAKRKQSNQTGPFKNNESMLRSIYEPNKSTKVTTNVKKTNATSNKKPIKPSDGDESIFSNGSKGIMNAPDFGDIFAIIEQKHATEMKALLQRQQEEQRKMQDEFLRQQEDLLKKISNLVNSRNERLVTPNGDTQQPKSDTQLSNEAKKSNEKMLIEEVNKENPVIFDSNGNRINRFTPENSKCIRRLSYNDNNKLERDDYNRSIPSSLSTLSSDQSDYSEYTAEEVKAANTIAAHMRGYLTRRLFKTNNVQNIVKVLHDTLLILLDMHREKDKLQSKADIELKFHMIQQVIHFFP